MWKINFIHCSAKRMLGDIYLNFEWRDQDFFSSKPTENHWYGSALHPLFLILAVSKKSATKVFRFFINLNIFSAFSISITQPHQNIFQWVCNFQYTTSYTLFHKLFKQEKVCPFCNRLLRSPLNLSSSILSDFFKVWKTLNKSSLTWFILLSSAHLPSRYSSKISKTWTGKSLTNPNKTPPIK